MSESPRILYEDNHLLVVDKPAGLLTQPSGTSQDSLESWAKNYIKEKYQKPGNVFLEAVHRLDKPVSGIVVFAKTSKALSRLQEAMRSKSCRKIYEALVENLPPQQEGILEHYLIHDDYQASVVAKSVAGAKLCRLHYRVLEGGAPYIKLEIELETGRYHQIRAQLSAIGCPIVGDVKYGSKSEFEGSKIALKHVKMELPHPVTQVKLILTAE
jgi:23S rRNA pseudouridine1911/1915/1917 synthase